MIGIGKLFTGREMDVEVRLIAGWGALCIWLTLCATTLSIDLRFPLGGAGLIGAAGFARWRGGPDWPRSRAAAKLLLLTLPLWLVMLGARPAEIDTWWNLLPNVAYLYDHSTLPVEGGLESYSFLPAAPYNTQFVAWAASVMSGSLAESALTLFNVLLLCAAALLVARRIATQDGRGPVPAWACALGFLLVGPLNPGFTPRVFISSYGETGLAVTAVCAVLLVADLLDELANGRPGRGRVAYALTLAAMVNVKQSGFGLVLSIAVSAFALSLLNPKLRNGRAPRLLVVCLVPALALYAIWRLFVTAEFPSGELRMLPMSDWNWMLLPQTLGAIVHAVLQKAFYFSCTAIVIAVAGRHWLTRTFHRGTALLTIAAGAQILFTGFLVFTYLAHFDPASAAEAHSFFRYSVQLSLVTVIGLVSIARPWMAPRLVALPSRTQRRLAVAAMIVAFGLPFAGFRLLRFDLDAPQPTIWALARAVGSQLDRPRIALLLPGDVDDGVGSMLRGVIMFTPPRVRNLDIAVRLAASPATLAELAADGYDTALISCTGSDLAAVPGLEKIPSGVAALVRRDAAAWYLVRVWPYPPGLASQRFAGLIERAPLCAGPINDVTPAIAWHRPS